MVVKEPVMSKKTYAHFFSFTFRIESNDPCGFDIAPQQFRDAVLAQLDELKPDEQLLLAIGPPDVSAKSSER